MRIIVDGMGGDNAPLEIVKGSVEAVLEYGISITLTGDSDQLKAQLKSLNAPMDHFEIVHASEVITMEDSPVAAIRKKKDSSMVRGFELVKEDPDSVFISAGNTGALMAGSLLKVGRIKGIDRPALAPVLTNRGNGTLLIDAGANTEVKPENLVQFAIMGSVYMEKVLGRKQPSVGLLNIGTEESKGTEVYKSAYHILKDLKRINFVGNIEARDVPAGVVDVLVCDGFTGNIVLKYTEGLAVNLFGMIKEELMKTTIRKIGAMLIKPGLSGFKQKMDYAETGGAPLLGINGGIIKAHGSSNAKAIKNAIRQGKLFLDNKVLSSISSIIPQLSVDQA
ncbi:MAG TPA: phosphate acyltransferase PlsX [Candidatus Atribacteria bacterium]|nr:phosphate acyltransferase PlsX [Candidatus Atribacteria bacterium]HPT77816.1 phosphate acyltransferase PlsX [Candidatus Atribacteria bacterium]